MFVRIINSGNNQYLQIVEYRKIKGEVVQRVISTIGRLNRLNEKGDIETLVRSLSRFSEKVLLVLSGNSEVSCQSKKIGQEVFIGKRATSNTSGSKKAAWPSRWTKSKRRQGLTASGCFEPTPTGLPNVCLEIQGTLASGATL